MSTDPNNRTLPDTASPHLQTPNFDGSFGIREPPKAFLRGFMALTIGTAMCALGCAAPLFIGALVAGGGAVASLLGPGLELAGVVVALGGVALLLVGLWRHLRGAKASEDPGGCGCTSAEAPVPEHTLAEVVAPIACTLDASSARARAEAYRSLFSEAFVCGERITDGHVRWRFRGEPAVDGVRGGHRLARIQQLAAQEQACCSFLRIDIHVSGDEIWWETRAPADAHAVLDEFFALPETLAMHPNE
jgi:hypothetical protein